MRRAAWSAASCSPIVAMRQVPTGWTGPDVKLPDVHGPVGRPVVPAHRRAGLPEAAAHRRQRAGAAERVGVLPAVPVRQPAAHGPHPPRLLRGGLDAVAAARVRAAAAIALLLRDRIGSGSPSPWWCCGEPCRPPSCSRSATRRPWRWPCSPCSSCPEQGALAVGDVARALLGLTRPIAVPIAAVTVVALWCRWRARTERPLVAHRDRGRPRRAGGVRGVRAALAGHRRGGDRPGHAYTVTMSTWRGSREIVPVRPWLDMSRYYFGQTWGPVWLPSSSSSSP